MKRDKQKDLREICKLLNYNIRGLTNMCFEYEFINKYEGRFLYSEIMLEYAKGIFNVVNNLRLLFILDDKDLFNKIKKKAREIKMHCDLIHELDMQRDDVFRMSRWVRMSKKQETISEIDKYSKDTMKKLRKSLDDMKKIHGGLKNGKIRIGQLSKS